MLKRTANLNAKQKEALLEFIRKNPRLRQGKFTKDFTHKESQQLWQSAANILNTIPHGGIKTWKQWRKVWQDIKTNAKSKKAGLNGLRGNSIKGIDETSVPLLFTNGDNDFEDEIKVDVAENQNVRLSSDNTSVSTTHSFNLLVGSVATLTTSKQTQTSEPTSFGERRLRLKEDYYNRKLLLYEKHLEILAKDIQIKEKISSNLDQIKNTLIDNM